MMGLERFSGPWTSPLGMGVFMGVSTLLFLALMVWSIIWKGMALWKAARLGNKGWFIALLVINTVGILEILYLYIFSKKSESQSNQQQN